MRRLVYTGAFLIALSVAWACNQGAQSPGAPPATPPPPGSGAHASLIERDRSAPVKVTARIRGQPGQWDGKRFITLPSTLVFSFSGSVNAHDVEAKIAASLGEGLASTAWTGDELSVTVSRAATGTEYTVDFQGIRDQHSVHVETGRSWQFEVVAPFEYQSLNVLDGTTGPLRTISLPLFPIVASANGKWMTAVLVNGRQRYPYLISLDTGQAVLIGDENEYLLDFEGAWRHQVSNSGRVSWMRDARNRVITSADFIMGSSLRVEKIETPQALCDVALSPTGNLMAILSLSGQAGRTDLSVVDLRSAEILHQYSGLLSVVKYGDVPCDGGLAWTADESALVALDREGKDIVTRLVEFSSGMKIGPLPPLRGFTGLPVSPGRTHLWTGEGISRWDGRVLYPIEQASAYVLWSPEGGWSAISGATGRPPVLLNLKTGQLEQLRPGRILAWTSESTVLWSPTR